MNTKIVSLAIAAAISIILVAGVLMPAINDAEDGQTITYTNYGYQAQAVSGSSAISYTWDSTNGITIGTSTISPSQAANGPMVIFASDAGYAKTNFAGTSGEFYGIVSSAITAGSAITACTITVDPTAKTVAITDITASTTIADVTLTYSDWCFIPAVEGDIVMYAPYTTAKTFYAEDDSDVYSFFRSGATWAVSYTGTTAVNTYGSSTITTDFDGTAVSGYEGLYSYSIDLTPTDYFVTVSDTSYGPSVIVMDKQASGTTETGNQITPILAVIPVLVIVAILAIIVRSSMKP